MFGTLSMWNLLRSWWSVLQVRFACIICVGVVHLICALLLIARPNMMAFRVGGALESLQDQYFLLNLCFSMVTFDLQAQVNSSSDWECNNQVRCNCLCTAEAESLHALIRDMIVPGFLWFLQLCISCDILTWEHVHLFPDWRKSLLEKMLPGHNAQLYVYSRKGKVWWW